MRKWVDILPKSVEGTLADVWEVILNHAATRAVLNAPILEGPLRRGIKRTKVQVRPGKGIGGEVYVRAGVPYAMRRHEEIYNLGPVSRQQPDTVEGGVGRKYISRIFRFHKNRYDKLVVGSLNKVVLQKADKLVKQFSRASAKK